MRRQRPIKGFRRIPSWGNLDPNVRRWIDQQATRFGCSRSFVINNACAYAGNIDLREPISASKAKPHTPVLHVIRRKAG